MTRGIVFVLAAFVSLLFLSCGNGAASFTYLALGDSLAVGIGASDPLTNGYVPLVQAELGDDVELVNLGVGGALSADLLEEGDQLDQALDEIESRASDDDDDNDIEVITIDIGGNDLRQLTEEGSPCVVDPLSAGCLQEAFPQVLSEYEDNLSEILRALRGAAPDAEIVVVNLYNPLTGSGDPLETGADVIIQQFNSLVAQVAAEAEVQAQVADVFPLFRQRPGEVVAPDLIHANDEGHALMADAVIAALEES